MKCIAKLAMLAGASALLHKKKTATALDAAVPITERVEIEGTEVYGQTAGHGDLNTCKAFAPSFVKDAAKPSVTVCGTGTKVRLHCTK